MDGNGHNGLLPIDIALLKILPEDGQMLGFTPIAVSVHAVTERTEFKHSTANQIGGRFKSLQFRGLVRSQVILPVQQGLGWQITAAGKKALQDANAKKGVAV